MVTGGNEEATQQLDVTGVYLLEKDHTYLTYIIHYVFWYVACVLASYLQLWNHSGAVT